MAIILDGTDSIGDLGDALAAKLTYVRAATAPTGAYGIIWINTSTAALLPKQWNGTAWVSFSGSGPAVVSSTTGSPTITTDATYTYYEFTGDGTLVVGTEGVVTCQLIGGGGGGSGSGGGAGGMVISQFLLPVGTATVKIGAGGAAVTQGGDSHIGTSRNGLLAKGGGRGVIAWQAGVAGGCGGGSAGSGVGLADPPWQGNNGGNLGVGTYSGGGGQGGVGGNNNGGPGIQSTFGGSSKNRAAGGRGNGAADGTYWTGVANSGDGGRSVDGLGFSGVVIVRVG